MTVYIDNAFIQARVGRRSSRWCHLFADTEEELHAFAARIGLLRSWYQVPKGPGGKGRAEPTSLKAQMWHYDVTEGRRVAAVSAGAVEVTTREALQIMRARHARLFPEQARRLDEVPPGGGGVNDAPARGDVVRYAPQPQTLARLDGLTRSGNWHATVIEAAEERIVGFVCVILPAHIGHQWQLVDLGRWTPGELDELEAEARAKFRAAQRLLGSG